MSLRFQITRDVPEGLVSVQVKMNNNPTDDEILRDFKAAMSKIEEMRSQKRNNAHLRGGHIPQMMSDHSFEREGLGR